MIADRELTLADIIEYNRSRPFEERKALLYGEGPTFQVRTLADELPSILVGGLPGFGKTSAVAFLCTQIVMCLGKLVVIDPHCFAPRDSLAKIVAPLSPWFALPMIDFEDSHQVVSAFQFVLSEYERRNRKHARPGEPLFLICDEWNLLLDMLDDDELEVVIRTVRTVARSARKFGIWLCLIAQNWNLDSSGGPEVRKSITGRLSFAQELSDMRMTLNTRDNRSLADLTSTPLGKGDCIFKHPSYGMKRVWFPPMDKQECEIVAQNMRAVLGHSEPETSENGTFGHSEYQDSPPPLLKPTHDYSSFTTTHPNVVPNGPNVAVNEEERRLIIEQGNKQLLETGHVVRTRIQKALGWNSDGYEKIKNVCDELGWHKDMQPQKVSDEDWRAIKERYNFTCLKCGRQEPEIILEPDRIVPGALGGKYDPENIQPLCRSCNARKGTSRTDYRDT
jgi:HNH endonuclease